LLLTGRRFSAAPRRLTGFNPGRARGRSARHSGLNAESGRSYLVGAVGTAVLTAPARPPSTSPRLRETSAKAVASHCRQSDRVGTNGDPSSPGASASRRAWMPCPDSPLLRIAPGIPSKGLACPKRQRGASPSVKEPLGSRHGLAVFPRTAAAASVTASQLKGGPQCQARRPHDPSRSRLEATRTTRRRGSSGGRSSRTECTPGGRDLVRLAQRPWARRVASGRVGGRWLAQTTKPGRSGLSWSGADELRNQVVDSDRRSGDSGLKALTRSESRKLRQVPVGNTPRRVPRVYGSLPLPR
jgi:hypothetical protein